MGILEDIGDSLSAVADNLRDLLDLASDVVGDMVGTGTPRDQIIASFIVGGAIIATTSVGLIGTILLIPIPIFFLIVGFARFADPVNERWPL